jgi:hypothetical protein
MAETSSPLTFTDVEVRSYLPTGWGIRPGARGRWDGKRRRWTIEVYDGADNVWTVAVDGKGKPADRLEALRLEIDRLFREALGRKSIITG